MGYNPICFFNLSISPFLTSCDQCRSSIIICFFLLVVIEFVTIQAFIKLEDFFNCNFS